MFESCRYVGSRALVNLCDRKPPIPVPDFDGLNPAVYNSLTEDNQILQVCPQALKNFVSKVLPTINRPFVLLTNNSDWTIPIDVQDEFDTILKSGYLTHWFAQNCIVDHSKVTRIPIGLDYHTLTPSRKQAFVWSPPEKHPWGIKHYPAEQEHQLCLLQSQSTPFWNREVKAYANFQFLMTTRYGKVDRVDAYETVPKDLVFYEPSKCTRIVCWQNMIEYAFVLSPQGNGLDCHRTWEALCLGCIPIVKTSGLDPLFEGLPVWIVQSWSDVTEENMKCKINEFRERTFRLERLTLSYWRDLIHSAKTR